MITISFQEQDPDILFNNFLREDHHKTRLKNLVLYLKSTGMPHKEIKRLCRISGPTLSSYLKDFKTGGFEGLKKLKWAGQRSKLHDFKELIDADLSSRPPRSIQEARQRIGQLTGIDRSPTQIRDFLKNKLGYRHLKAGSVPGNGKGDDQQKEAERQDFKKNDLNHSWAKQRGERG